MFPLSYLEISLASVQQDFGEEFHIFLFHQFVGVDPGALMQPQVHQVCGVTDTLRQGKQDTLQTNTHGINNHMIQKHTFPSLHLNNCIPGKC